MGKLWRYAVAGNIKKIVCIIIGISELKNKLADTEKTKIDELIKSLNSLFDKSSEQIRTNFFSIIKLCPIDRIYLFWLRLALCHHKFGLI